MHFTKITWHTSKGIASMTYNERLPIALSEWLADGNDWDNLVSVRRVFSGARGRTLGRNQNPVQGQETCLNGIPDIRIASGI